MVTATFRLLYVFVVIHHGSRRLLHFNVTTHPTAAWTLQQLREAIGFEDAHRYMIHDRDSIIARSLDESLKRLAITIAAAHTCHWVPACLIHLGPSFQPRIPASDRRPACGACQVGAGWVASRVLVAVRAGVTEFLRSTEPLRPSAGIE